MPRKKFVQVESKNAIIELLEEGRSFMKILIANSAYKDPKTQKILMLASKKRVPIERISRKSIQKYVKSGYVESVVGLMVAENMWRLSDLLEKLREDNKFPFFIILDHIKYDQNIGAILRTAYASGVNGIITPIDIKNFLNNETIRISMGASLRIPIIEMNLFTAIKELQKEGVKVYALDMDGKLYYKEDLRGSVAFVLGAEDVGVSSKIKERVDARLTIPMREEIGSLNVSASGAVIMYEKLRQELS